MGKRYSFQQAGKAYAKPRQYFCKDLSRPPNSRVSSLSYSLLSVAFIHDSFCVLRHAILIHRLRLTTFIKLCRSTPAVYRLAHLRYLRLHYGFLLSPPTPIYMPHKNPALCGHIPLCVIILSAPAVGVRNYTHFTTFRSLRFDGSQEISKKKPDMKMSGRFAYYPYDQSYSSALSSVSG